MSLKEYLIFDDAYVSIKLEQLTGKNLFLFGAGAGAKKIIQYLKKRNLNPIYICDNNEFKIGTTIENIEVKPFSFVLENYEHIAIIISAPHNINSIEKYLLNYISEYQIYFFMPKLEDLDYINYINENIFEIEKLYSSLEDDFSKKTLVNVINGKLTGNYNYFKEVFQENQYFPKDIKKFSESETFLDVGAYIGDTIVDFMNNVSNKYRNIVAIEPNEQCFESLDVLAEEYDIKKGVSNKQDMVYFDDELDSVSSSAVVQNKVTHDLKQLEVDKIDNLVNSEVSFLKMDIEGLELLALEGAKDLIKKYEPDLAICIYHKNSDYVDISKFISGLGIHYKLYIRHYTMCEDETVLYAVKENDL